LKGENEALVELLNANVDVNAQDKEGLTALHCAASKGHVDCIETLLNFGNADLIALDRLGASPLHYATTFGQLDATRLLIASGCSVDFTDFRGRTVVHCAAARGDSLQLNRIFFRN
jgi:ankyrin repeat protein